MNLVPSRLVVLANSEMNEIYKKMSNFSKPDISALRTRTFYAYSKRMLKIATSGVKKASFKIANAKSKVGNHFNHNMRNQVITKKYHEFSLSILTKILLVFLSILQPLLLYVFHVALYRNETNELYLVLGLTKNIIKKEIAGTFIMTYIPIHSYSDLFDGINADEDALKGYLDEIETNS